MDAGLYFGGESRSRNTRVRLSLRRGLVLASFLTVVLLQVPYSKVAAEEIETQKSNAPAQVIDFLRRSAIPLKTTNPDSDLSDMERLRPIVGDARIVAMGEATHGTREFFLMKHRMFELLVEKMGFTVFGIEANWPESLAVNDYVLNGNGDPATALAGMYFWTWNTEEVLDLIRWMRRYTEDPSHPRKVKFYGFDMQFARVAVPNVEAYLEKIDPAEAEKAANILSPLADQKSEDTYHTLPADERKKTADGIKLLLDDFDSHKAAYVAASSEVEWTLAQHNLEIAHEAEELHSSPTNSGIRDRYMAGNVKWILDHEPTGTKMMLWAHNAHVGTAAWTWGESMGAVLRNIYGKSMLICGFSFYEGSFQAIVPHRGLQDVIVGPSPSYTFDSALADTGLRLLAIDLRNKTTNSVVKDWLSKPHDVRSIGAVYNEALADRYFVSTSSDTFDVIFFVNWTTPARENRPLPKELDVDPGRG
jgi:erythromycin esterase